MKKTHLNTRMEYLNSAMIIESIGNKMPGIKNTAFSFLWVAAWVGAHAEQVSRPNVVVIIADDLGYADMAFLPHAPQDVKHFGTPGFDRLAATGTYFQNAYSTAPICSPARAGLITGRYQQRWGNYWYSQGGLPQEELTLPELLGESGYLCAKFGKTHLSGGPKEFPTLHGFDRYLGFMHHTWDYIRLSQKDVDAYRQRGSFKEFGSQVLGPLLKADRKGVRQDQAESVSYEDGFTTRIFTDEAVNVIKEEKGGKPFYLHVAYNAVHQPTYIVEESWAKKVGARYVPWNRNAPQWGFPYWEPDEESNKDFHSKWGYGREIDIEGRRCYLAQLLALDHGVGRILDALEASGQRENTIVFFLSDNGGERSAFSCNDPLSGFKYMFGEGGVRIPMLVSMPGVLPEGSVNKKAIVSIMDIFPTVVELAGIPVPGNLDGRSLRPVLSGERETGHEWLAWAQDREKWVVRKGPWKLANNVGWRNSTFKVLPNGDVAAGGAYIYPGGVQLYNLEDDLGESRNLMDQYPEVVKELRALHAEWDASMDDPRRPRR
jgi:arylsulfatase B